MDLNSIWYIYSTLCTEVHISDKCNELLAYPNATLSVLYVSILVER